MHRSLRFSCNVIGNDSACTNVGLLKFDYYKSLSTSSLSGYWLNLVLLPLALMYYFFSSVILKLIFAFDNYNRTNLL
jgi:hypothetical protein